MNRSESSTPGIRGSREQRLFGYCGRGGEKATRALAAARAVAPEFDPVAPAAGVDDGRFTAFGLTSRGVPSLAHAHVPDGSFMVIDGSFSDERYPVQRVLDDWIRDGTATFHKHRFHGFVAAWNAETSTCVLLRDPYGIAPGYIAEIEHGVVFSTDLAPLIRFGVDSTPSDVALDAFLAAGHFPAPMTPVSSISKLPPGHSISITAEGMTESVPWFRHRRPESVSREEAVELMGIRLKRSLERTWPSDGDVGLLLSGGVDSAVILAGVTRMLDRPIRAFTFRYESYQGKLNEGGNARAIADHLGVAHEEIPIRPHDILDDIGGAVTAYGEPFTWGLHSYRLGPVAERGITSVFSGTGADGWGLSKRHRAALRFNRLPAPIRGSVRAAVRAVRPLKLNSQAKSEWVTESVSGVGEMYAEDSDWDRHLRRRLYRDPTLPDRSARRLLGIYQDAADEFEPSESERTLVLLDKRFSAAETMLAWNRAWTLAFGLELGLPFYDHDLLDLAMNVEGEATGKDLLRELASRYLPHEMAYAPKIPQQMPVSDWIRGPLSEPIRERLGDLPEAMTAIFEPTGVLQLVDEHVAGKMDHGWRLIALLTIATWLDQRPG